MKKRIIGISLSIGVVLALGACATNLSSIVILGLVLPDETCTYATGGARLSETVVDLNVARSASIGVLARNSMIPSESIPNRLTELRTMLVEGAYLKYRTGNFAKLTDRLVAAIGAIDPGDGTATIPVEVLSARDIDVLRGDLRLQQSLGLGQTVVIQINIKLDGRITDGGRMQSTEVSVPVRLCKGCLRLAPTKPDVTALCAAGTTPVAACVYGQDVALEYCQYESLRR